MSQIVIGSLTLSLIHALIPSHWLPIIMIGKAQDWERTRLLLTAGLAGLAHTISTTIVGVLVSFAGLQFAKNQLLISSWIVPTVLLAWGIWFLVQHYRHQAHNHINKEKLRGKTYPQLLVSLVMMMFLSPCLEINAYFLSAGAKGWHSVLAIVIIYNVLTVTGILAMVLLVDSGIKQVNFGWIRHEQLISGLTLVCLAFLNFFIGL